MDPTLTWLDLTASDRDKMQRVLDLFREQGTVDEMGLGTLRDALSNALFPGITSIQTRLRYVLFIPWVYRILEGRRIADDRLSEEARKVEIRLIDPLAESDDRGVIGISARHELKRLPSSVYWSCMRHWGIFQHPQSQSWYHTHFSRLRDAGSHLGRADDPGVTWLGQPNWHPRLPNPPDDFPYTATFELSRPEAEFVQGRIEERCAGTLLAYLASRPTDVLADHFWEEPGALGAEERIRSTVEVARRFSLHVEGMPLIYNLLLAERRWDLFGEDAGGLVERYTEACREWAAREASEDDFDPWTLWTLVERRGRPVNLAQRRFVETWTAQIVRLGPENASTDEDIRALVSGRERVLKGRQRARLANPNRLLDWNGESGVGRLDFNWSRAREMLAELYLGLG